MTAEEKLKIYRDFVLMLSGYMASGHVQVSSCRVLVGIQLDRLVRDAKAALGGIEKDTIGTSIRLTEEEHKELQEKING